MYILLSDQNLKSESWYYSRFSWSISLKENKRKSPVLPHFLPFSDGNSDGLLYENRKFIHIAGFQFKRRMHITVEGNIDTGVS